MAYSHHNAAANRRLMRPFHPEKDRAAVEGSGAAGTILAGLVPAGDGDRRAGAERAAGGRALPRRACRPADHADLRPAEAEAHAEHRGADLDLSDGGRVRLLPGKRHSSLSKHC